MAPLAAREKGAVGCVRSLAVLCPASSRRPRRPLAQVGTADRGLIFPSGSKPPLGEPGFPTIHRVTDSCCSTLLPLQAVLRVEGSVGQVGLQACPAALPVRRGRGGAPASCGAGAGVMPSPALAGG